MIRRLEPMDRAQELGDVSVPLPFDVHAMIRTSNERKEFFLVSIDEIREELDQLKSDLGIDSELRLTLLAEAKEYRMSEAKRKHLEESWNQ